MKPSSFRKTTVVGSVLTATLLIGSAPASAAGENDCRDLPSYADLTDALDKAVAESNGGLANDMWATIVNRDGIVCAVTFSGGDRGDQWPGSRVISSQKANTANAFSLPDGAGGISGLSLSTANLWTAAQPGGSTFVGNAPGGSLFGLQFSNPVATDVAYKGPAKNFGKSNDPMVGGRIGGVNVFGGGLALYALGGELLGAVGVSGDTSCTDHNVAWRVRDTLALDYVPAGVGTPVDNIVFDVTDTGAGNASSAGGFGHPQCDADSANVNTAVVTACPPNDGATDGCVAD
jgi:uncharacterized protein GlcG (DUF336 family)